MYSKTNRPLADRMRPTKLEDVVGQPELTGEAGLLTRAIAAGKIPSMVLWGPPGVGKTSIAHAIQKSLSDKLFFKVNAIDSGVKELREILRKSRGDVLFIDEIHRFSKSQQDVLLAAVEAGKIILIGATTENPSFEVISALLSRCQVFTLKQLSEEDLKILAVKAMREDEALQTYDIEIKEWEALFYHAGYDARKMLNLLEWVVIANETEKLSITNTLVEQVAQQKSTHYDKNGEQHYDIISAFIKSVRGSDVEASIYWLARMLAGGEDPKFIARRLVILAAEDIGLANPNALLMANAAMDAVQNIGMPEARIVLAEASIYLAKSAKSNAAYEAINKALAYVQKHPDAEVPIHLRNAPTQLMKELGYGKAYLYPHDYPNSQVAQSYLPPLKNKPTFFKDRKK